MAQAKHRTREWKPPVGPPLTCATRVAALAGAMALSFLATSAAFSAIYSVLDRVL